MSMAATSATTGNARVPVEALEIPGRSPALILCVARWVLVAALIAAPLAFGAVQPWAWTSLLIICLCLWLMWAIGNAARGELRIYWSPLFAPALLFLAVCGFQLYGGVALDPYAARESILKLVTVLMIFFVAGQFFAGASTAPWDALGLAVTLYVFSLGLFAILQYFSSHNLIYWMVKSDGWAFGPYVNHNHYAGLMEMLIPISAAYVFSRPRSDPRRFLLAFSLCVPAASVMLSGSRGGFISLLVETLILGWILWRFAPEGASHLRAMLGIGIPAAALLFFWIAPARVVSRLAGMANVNRMREVTLRQRELVAIDTLHIFRDHPWLGTGAGSFATVFPQYRTFPTDLNWAHAHDDYLEALAETGAAGGILIAAALVLFFRLAFENLDQRLRSETGWMQFGAALGCCGLLVHSLADFNLHIPANAAWFAVCVALATAPLPAARQKASGKEWAACWKDLHGVP